MQFGGTADAAASQAMFQACCVADIPPLAVACLSENTPPEGEGVTLSDELYARIEALSPRPAPATDRLEEAAA